MQVGKRIVVKALLEIRSAQLASILSQLLIITFILYALAHAQRALTAGKTVGSTSAAQAARTHVVAASLI